ncbi:GNAT family N-acetyltransferase [Flindersiella endophytica]
MPTVTTLTRLPDVRSATDADLDAAAAHFNRLRAETHPDDPPAPIAEIRALRNIPPTVDVWPWWLCRSRNGDVAGECHLFGGTGADAHVLFVELGVRADHRRRRIATRILREVAEVAEANGRTLLRATTTERVPAGAAFCHRLGAQPVAARHTNRLRLADLDHAQLTAWSQAAPEYPLTALSGPCPSELLEALAEILRMVNDDESFTPERIQEAERMDQAARATRWLLTAGDGRGGLAGFTELRWYAANPLIIRQGWTFVRPEHRRRGLGRKLKATMLLRVLAEAEAEAAEYVDTGNDDTNEPMLAINRALGFRPHVAETTWELGVDRLRAHLA